MGNVCQRGDIWLVDFNPGRGSEQIGVRPALIIQNDLGNKYAATTIVAVITSTIKKYPVTVILEKDEVELKQRSMVNFAQLLTIDKDRLLKKIGEIGPQKLKEANEALKISLGI